MKINSGKSHILFSGNDNVSANINDNTNISENKNEPLGIILDSKSSLEDHINNLCKKENVLHERALRITYGDRSFSYQDLLKKDNSVSIHHKNIPLKH